MNSKRQPRFSVVIPAYNEAHFIADCLASLHAQDFSGEVEIIVVDNNSTDATAEIAKSLGAKVVAEKQKGVCHARQAGTQVAQGEIIISTDADSYYDHNWLSRIDQHFTKNSKVVGVAGKVRYMNAPVWAGPYTNILFGLVGGMYRITGRVFYISACDFAFYKSAWGGYNTALTQGGDELDLLAKLKQQGKVIYDSDICTYTSARRQVRGFLYNLFVTFFIYYLLDYGISRVTHKSSFGSYPAYRNEISPKVLLFLQTCFVAIVVFGFMVYTHPGRVLYRKARSVVSQAPSEIRERMP